MYCHQVQANYDYLQQYRREHLAHRPSVINSNRLVDGNNQFAAVKNANVVVGKR